MRAQTLAEKDFIEKLGEVTEANLSNEHFGVSELADEMGMSRSNLLRKVKSATRLSVTQYIRQARLKKALEMLRKTSLTVSEISYSVGFGGTSYFIKCFHDHYGYPPGEVGSMVHEEIKPAETSFFIKKRSKLTFSAISVIILTIILTIVFKSFPNKNKEPDKTIVVLPFKNDSSDSTNIYVINGLMESINNNLSKIRDLTVISRTSAEKYRNTTKLAKEISRELNVNYLIEGSGQKYDDRLFLTIQLIEAKTDKHILSRQYERKSGDEINLQIEIANEIANEIHAIITPEEKALIETKPTDNKEAYDLFLEGREYKNKQGQENLEKAIELFKKALELDDNFALAYAEIALTYYQMGSGYATEIFRYADRALIINPKLAEGLYAKAMYYVRKNEIQESVFYLEKSLLYNPNSWWPLRDLGTTYCHFFNNYEKYLFYALKAMQLDPKPGNSTGSNADYYMAQAAFRYAGFFKECGYYLDKYYGMDGNRFYYDLNKARLISSRDEDFQKSNEIMLPLFEQDTTKDLFITDISTNYLFLRDYDSAYKFYNKVHDIVKNWSSYTILKEEYGRLAFLFSKYGRQNEAGELIRFYYEKFKDKDSGEGKRHLSAYYSYTGDTENAFKQMNLMLKSDNYRIDSIISLKYDPLFDNIRKLPEFKKLLAKITDKFWKDNQRIRTMLEEQGLLYPKNL